jgi:hypothetical protein
VLDVPGRTYIKIHRGRTIKDILGCILPATSLSIETGLWFANDRHNAFDSFMRAMNGKRISVLEVRNAYSVQDGELYEVK